MAEPDVLTAEPEPSRCSACGDMVLIVIIRHRGCVLVEPLEVECPVMTCPKCLGVKPGCTRCDGHGKVGVPLPREAIAVSEQGSARHWRREWGGRRPGEGLYREHACSLARSA